MPPKDKHRAWAEMIRTAAAICTVILTVVLTGDTLGVW